MTAAEFTHWRRSTRLTQVEAAKAIGMGLMQLRAIEQGPPAALVRRTIALAVRALAAGLDA